MTVAQTMAQVIIANFLQRRIDQISQEVGRSFDLRFKLVLDDETVLREVCSPRRVDANPIVGEVRVLAAAIFVKGKYKYKLQCLFERSEDLQGFSGISTKGVVKVDGEVGVNKNHGYINSHNEWNWREEFLEL